jgi:hypothetical protein
MAGSDKCQEEPERCAESREAPAVTALAVIASRNVTVSVSEAFLISLRSNARKMPQLSHGRFSNAVHSS